MEKFLKTKFSFLILILFTLFSIIFFIINQNYRIIYNLNLNVHCNSNSPTLIKSIFKGLVCNANLNIDSNVPEINLLLNPKNLLLSKSLMENVISGNFENYNTLNKRFKTKIIYKDKVYKAKIKFHGKNPSLQHIKGQFFSMDVKILNGKAIKGLTSFDLILKDRMNPKSLFLPIISSKKLVYQNPILFKVKINSAEWQYFYIQPNRNEKFFSDYGLNIFLPNLNENKFQNKRGFVFEKDYKDLNKNDAIFKNLKIDSHKESISIKYNELNHYLFNNNKHTNINRFFDVEYLSNFLAIFLLLGCDPHGNSDGNLLVGFNFDNGKFYPILHRDYNPRYLSIQNFKECFLNKQFLNKLLSDPVIRKGIIKSIASIEKNLAENNKLYQKRLKKYYLTTLIASYIYNFHNDIFLNDLEVFSKNLVFIKQNLFLEKLTLPKENNKSNFDEQRFRNSLKHSQLNFDVDYNNHLIKIFGKNIIRNNIEFPFDFPILIDNSTSIHFEEKAFLKFHNDLTIRGNKKNPIKIFGNYNGTIIISDLMKKNIKLIISNAYIEKLVETVDDGIRYMGGITALSKAKVKIKNSTLKQFLSEDMINLKGFNQLTAVISENKFFEIFNDGIDLDFVNKSIFNKNIISASKKTTNKNSDGLDFSGTFFEINNNIVENFLDKCVSVGEASKGILYSNFLKNCNIGIANKDGSIINLSDNNFENNNQNILSYVKKKSFQKPILNYVK